MKKALRILGILLVLLVALAFLIPYLYQDEIKEYIITEVNKDLKGELTIDHVGLSLIRSFPDLQVDLSGVNLRSDLDSTHPIMKGEHVGLDLDIMSVLRKDEVVQIKGVKLESPSIYIHYPKGDAPANYDIFPSTESSGSESSSYAFRIQSVEINNGSLLYIDDKGGHHIDLQALNHTGSGSFVGDDLDYASTTNIAQSQVTSAGTKYLKDAALDAEIDVKYNTATSKVDFTKNLIGINDLQLSTTGWIWPKEDVVEMDLIIDAPDNDFGSLWSIVPPVFKQDFNNLQTSGGFDLEGVVKGDYDLKTGDLPGLNFRLKVDDGYVQYPDLPHPLKSIFTDLVYDKKEGSANANINLKKLSFKAGQSFADVRGAITQQPNDILARGKADLDINLSDLPLEGEGEGKIVLDVDFDGSSQQVQRQDYGSMAVSGSGSFQNVRFTQDGLPAVQANIPEMSFSPKSVEMNAVDLKLNDSDIAGSMTIQDPLGFVLDDVSPKVYAQTKSSTLDVDNIMSSMSSSEADTSVLSTVVSKSILPFGMELNWSGSIEKLTYAEQPLQSIDAAVEVGKDDVKIRNGSFSYEGSNFGMEGNLSNLNAFMGNTGELNGNINIQGDKIDLNPFMESESDHSSSSTESETFVLPQGFNVNIGAAIEEVIYGKMKLKDLDGEVLFANQELTFKDVKANYLDGQMALKGGFLSNGVEPSAFNLKYDVIKLPFQGILEQISWIDQLIPLSKYIEGIFNSTFIFEGILDDQMVPDLGSITASGYIETLQGQLGKVPFLEKVSKMAAVEELKGFSLTNTKNWFEIKDGKFIIQPFEYTYDDIKMEIAGVTSLDQSVSFDIKANVPKEKLDKVPGGNTVNTGISWLTNEINSRGLAIGEIENYTLGIDINGAITSPKVNVKLLDFSKSSVRNTVQRETEKIKETLKDTLTKKKDEIIEKEKEKLEEKAKEIQDSAKVVIEKEVDKKVDEVKEEIKKQTKGVLDSVLIENGEEAVDKIKDKLKDFNIFNRKKK